MGAKSEQIDGPTIPVGLSDSEMFVGRTHYLHLYLPQAIVLVVRVMFANGSFRLLASKNSRYILNKHP